MQLPIQNPAFCFENQHILNRLLYIKGFRGQHTRSIKVGGNSGQASRPQEHH